jgi:hypothetical protein
VTPIAARDEAQIGYNTTRTDALSGGQMTAIDRRFIGTTCHKIDLYRLLELLAVVTKHDKVTMADLMASMPHSCVAGLEAIDTKMMTASCGIL